MKEIERKFLVEGEAWKKNLTEADSSLIQQGYLTMDPDRVVRVRIRDSKAYLTIKNKPVGLVRSEYEYQIPVIDAQELLDMCLGNVLMKRRYLIDYEGYTWEVDEFLDHHEGLVTAEVEMKTERDEVRLPAWLGQEVSFDPQYSNMNLAKDGGNDN